MPIPTPEEVARMRAILPVMAEAIKYAENNRRNLGVLSVKTNNPEQVLVNSVNNNFNRWVSGATPAPWVKEKPAKFVDFMRRRWAPLQSEGAANDPKNLNVNWAPNVRSYLKRMLDPAEYELMRKLDFVHNGYRTSQSAQV